MKRKIQASTANHCVLIDSELTLNLSLSLYPDCEMLQECVDPESVWNTLDAGAARQQLLDVKSVPNQIPKNSQTKITHWWMRALEHQRQSNWSTNYYLHEHIIKLVFEAVGY
jgi:hypothetical protein